MSLATSRGEGDASFFLFRRTYRADIKTFLRRNLQSVGKKKALAFNMGTTVSAISSMLPSKSGSPIPEHQAALTGPKGKRSPNLGGGGDEEDSRPAKRRRVDHSHFYSGEAASAQTPLPGHTPNHNRSHRSSPVQPSDFYGTSKTGDSAIPQLQEKSKPAKDTTIPNSTDTSNMAKATTTAKKAIASKVPAKFHIDNFIPKVLATFQQTLRVTVQDIVASTSLELEEDEFTLPDGQWSIDIPCRVSVTIWAAEVDDNKPKDYLLIMLSKQAQDAKLRVYMSKDGTGTVLRKFVKLEPFYFLHNDLYLKRKLPRKANGQFGGYHLAFADIYRVSVGIESIESTSIWPPMDIPSTSDAVLEALDVGCGSDTTEDFHLYARTAEMTDLLATAKLTKVALQFCHNYCRLKPLHKSKIVRMPYDLGLGIAWSIPHGAATKAVTIVKDVSLDPSSTKKTSKTTKTLKDEPVPVLSPRKKRPSISRESEAPAVQKDEDVNQENTPKRAQRERKDVSTYNLKALSSMAQGKSPRKRKAQEIGDVVVDKDAITVTYDLGKAEATESGVKQQITVPGLACPFCACKNKSFDKLRLHLDSDHGVFTFHLRRNLPRVQFFVEVAKKRPSSKGEMHRSTTLQLTKPTTIFELEKYLAGDKNWTKGRHGPEHNTWPDHISPRDHPFSSSPPRASRISSPNTSHAEDPELRHPAKRRKVLVPHTAKPLYDLITKKRLVPGEELPDQDDPADETALHQKHRDMVNDFTDVTPDEKDYINEWNKFILPQRFPLHFLTGAVLRFAETKAEWFAEKKSRPREFAKHMSVLIMRGTIHQDDFFKAIDLFTPALNARDAREKAERERLEKGKGKGVEVASTAPKVRVKMGLFTCACGVYTQADRVICGSGTKCFNPWFCHDCAESQGHTRGNRAWKCSYCAEPTTT